MTGFLDRRAGIRALAFTGLLLTVHGSGGTAQVSRSTWARAAHGEIPIILREHASGGEGPIVVAGLTFSGSAIYDIVDAPASARRHNAEHPNRPARSPSTAFRGSLLGTALPMAIGAATLRTSYAPIGGALLFGGALLGPSVGHFYSQRRTRALTGIGLRAGLSAASVMLYFCCT